MQQRMVNLDEKSVMEADAIRESKVNEANYLLYVSKREQERTSDALDPRSIANVAIAVPPVVPVLPAHSPVWLCCNRILPGDYDQRERGVYCGVHRSFVPNSRRCGEYVEYSCSCVDTEASGLELTLLDSSNRSEKPMPGCS